MSRHNKLNMKNVGIALIFLLPNLLGFICFTAYPVVLSLFMSFTNWSLKKSVEFEFVGMRNYMDLVSSREFWFYLYNTLYFMIGIPFSIIGSLLLANLLVDRMMMKSKKRKFILFITVLALGAISTLFFALGGKKDTALILALVYAAAAAGIMFGSMSFRTMLYIPSFASGISTMILWKEIFNPYHGLFNNIISNLNSIFHLNIDAPTWLASTQNLLGFLPLPEWLNSGGFGLGAREAIIIMGVWMAIGGNNMILYIASISNIPDSMYEAADIDGAGSLAKFWYITIPSVAPTTFFISIMSVIGGLQGGFAQARIMTNGGPAGTTTTLGYHIYTKGFEELDFGYASAIAWIMFIMIFVLTIINWKYGNRKMEA
ncbi:MAG: sugar ABC transporter permease [Lentisphaerae bacterium]|nr:sugar ABC transporter permease [Lentisphaerota bacterium]MCP4103337.1 sugar ABC transporter permease [Lentisphaerota bacterium]